MIRILIILFVLVAICVFLSDWGYAYFTGYCGKKFLVAKQSDAKQASDIFCALNTRAKKLIHCLKEKYGKDNLYVARLDKYYTENDLRESKETFTLNKGDKIHICIRHPQTGNFFDINTLMFVLIHELTHIADPNYYPNDEHPETFWNLNIQLLKDAEECGVYMNVDYSKHPVEYCNLIINSNPITTSKDIKNEY